MTKTVKTELTRDEVLIILEVYNTIDAMVDDTMEMMSYSLRNMFDFRTPMNDCGHPVHYRASVMPDDPTAWYHDSEVD